MAGYGKGGGKGSSLNSCTSKVPNVVKKPANLSKGTGSKSGKK